MPAATSDNYHKFFYLYTVIVSGVLSWKVVEFLDAKTQTERSKKQTTDEEAENLRTERKHLEVQIDTAQLQNKAEQEKLSQESFISKLQTIVTVITTAQMIYGIANKAYNLYSRV